MVWTKLADPQGRHLFVESGGLDSDGNESGDGVAGSAAGQSSLSVLALVPLAVGAGVGSSEVDQRQQQDHDIYITKILHSFIILSISPKGL